MSQSTPVFWMDSGKYSLFLSPQPSATTTTTTTSTSSSMPQLPRAPNSSNVNSNNMNGNNQNVYEYIPAQTQPQNQSRASLFSFTPDAVTGRPSPPLRSYSDDYMGQRMGPNMAQLPRGSHSSPVLPISGLQQVPQMSTQPLIRPPQPTPAQLMQMNAMAMPQSTTYITIPPSNNNGMTAAALREREREEASTIHFDTADFDPRTTLMIRNIPNKYTQRMMLDFLDLRHRDTYDFFYLPIDFRNRCNVGYAFINMVDPKHVAELARDLHGKRWAQFNSDKICQVAYARMQGLEQILAHFQKSSLLDESPDVRPVITINGHQIPYPTGVRIRIQRIGTRELLFADKL